MRVLVAADAMAGLGPRDASEVIAGAFARLGAQVAVVPLADTGAGFASSVRGFEPDSTVAHPGTLADVVAAVMAPEPARYVDLGGVARPAWTELVAVTPRVLDGMRDALEGRAITAVVRSGTERATLTGLTGAVAERGRQEGTDLAETLAADTRVAAWCRAIGVAGDAPGAGAADGMGALFLALGAPVAPGLQVCIDGFDMATTVARADLSVTGAAVLDFHAVGGDVVKEVARLAGEALRPVIAIVGRNFVSSRELRLAGLESAHAILDGAGDDEPTPLQLAEVAARVARSWSW